MMNIFRLIGDLLHLLSIFLLLWKLKKNKSCVAMKVIFISSTAYLIFLMRVQPPISQTYDKTADSFPYVNYLIIPTTILSLLTTESYTVPEILWTFSIWLESAAIMPQLVLLQQLREVENLTSNYVAALGLYRAFYVLNWVYRFQTENYVNWISWIAGVVQVALYVDFFYYYAISKWYGQKLVLPFAQDVC